jgi:hypothetical protein
VLVLDGFCLHEYVLLWACFVAGACAATGWVLSAGICADLGRFLSTVACVST